MSRQRQIVVAICGAKRSGKDTFANMLKEVHGFNTYKIASRLKCVCADVFGLTPSQMEDDVKDDVDPLWGVSPRRIMQFVGTEMFQYKIRELLPQVDRAIWIQGTIRDIQSSGHARVVISDMRFKHEYDALRKAFCDDLHVVKIVREPPPASAVDLHESETSWMDIPHNIIIHNECNQPHGMLVEFDRVLAVKLVHVTNE